MPLPFLFAVALDCSLGEPPRVEIELIQAKPATRYDLNILQLSRRQVGAQAPTPVPRRTMGLTEAQIRVETKLASKSFRSGMEVCLRPYVVRIELHLQSTIFIARELTNEPCRRETALKHEHQHVAIDRRLAEASVARYRKVAEAALEEIGGIGPFGPDDLAGEEDRLRARLGAALQPVTKQLYETRRAAQAEIDTPQEYARLWSACGLKL